MKQQTARDFHIDNIKGVLIFLVVLGHMLGYLQETHSAFATGVRTFIYFFHIFPPLKFPKVLFCE